MPFLIVWGTISFYGYNPGVYGYQQYAITNTYEPGGLTREHTLPLIKTLQFLNELQWEVMVAKMSFHLQWKFHNQLCSCNRQVRGRVVAPTLKGPYGEDI